MRSLDRDIYKLKNHKKLQGTPLTLWWRLDAEMHSQFKIPHDCCNKGFLEVLKESALEVFCDFWVWKFNLE